MDCFNNDEIIKVIQNEKSRARLQLLQQGPILTALKNHFHAHFPRDPKKLFVRLDSCKSILKKSRVLLKAQFDQLYPNDGTNEIDSEKFDFSLWVNLISALIKDEKTKVVNDIRLWRNKFQHTNQIKENQFEREWNTGVDLAKQMGITNCDYNFIKTSPLDKTDEQLKQAAIKYLGELI